MARRNGWDIVIMNPPYVGRKELPKRLTVGEINDIELHYGETNDQMILFARRALQYVRPGGIVSMIFNDSILTSVDANLIRRRWVEHTTIRTMARTKCFEGRAVNGGVVVVRNAAPDVNDTVTWVEGYRKEVHDFPDASDERHLTAARRGHPSPAGTLEVWRTPSADLTVLPHRPLLLLVRARTNRSIPRGEGLAWLPDGLDELEREESKRLDNALQHKGVQTYTSALRKQGWYDELRPGEWTLLGLLITGDRVSRQLDD